MHWIKISQVNRLIAHHKAHDCLHCIYLTVNFGSGSVQFSPCACIKLSFGIEYALV